MNILFCSKSFPAAHERIPGLLPEDRIEFCGPEDVARLAPEADVLVPLITPISEEIIASGRFGLIHQFGVGLEVVDMEAATRHGVMVARVPSAESGNAGSVAEHALMLMIMLSRNLGAAARNFASGRFGAPTGQALIGRTACVVGLGGLGRELAKRLSAFEMTITAVDDRKGRSVSGADIETVRQLADLGEAVSEADYVILCINYTPKRHHLFGREIIARMKPGAFLINVARGGLLDQDALLDALREGRVAGAGLDVFWQEPVDPNHPLFAENVIATPHVAGVTDASYDGISRAFVANMERYRQGKRPKFLANAPDTLRLPKP
ncbi:D-isomer specific 2-hydroxyacid dehydrogenase NAD-binding protein [Desulfovibrio sp. X2]|uniref:2-hydroxyacid dehydrogenase n=1 Tax=Desulfovibrio sp. X2 TaxID=941449 RepID=UPI000358CD12|nr:2-hydroxyacid dehydrogenase [Desulfovibrio sp. X2]EPR41690.1 D-isomer specific 2-hydroxyacid dehydrogenase NAD-binding protein [Desulfovibrio sp. X2]